ncbi:hypothetical protein BDZ45DRAFT_703282 [Acephala macrosclerotiorum]|nr:hypothetical protein BDZ45DRAFT_703282 [Acephala macrosclerotiorum]
METIVLDSPYQEICAKILTSHLSSWLGEEKIEAVSKPQLNNTIIFSIGPGARDQALHRDSVIHHTLVKKIRVEKYDIRRETGVGYFVAGKKTTKANSATRFIPGSHLWSPSTPSCGSLTVCAELGPGDAFLMFGSCFHGRSANTTMGERQEENQYLANKWEVLREMCDVEKLKVFGWRISDPYLGWVDTIILILPYKL